MRESRAYWLFFQQNWGYLLGGGIGGVVVGVALMVGLGQRYISYSSLEKVVDESHIREASLLTDSAVVWGREVAAQRGWVGSGGLVRIYKDGPVVVHTEVEGVSSNVVKDNQRLNQELVAKYGFSVLVAPQVRREWRYKVTMVGVDMLIGVSLGMGICLGRIYWRKY